MPVASCLWHVLHTYRHGYLDVKATFLCGVIPTCNVRAMSGGVSNATRMQSRPEELGTLSMGQVHTSK